MSLPKPYYEDGQATIYHGDCREILPLLGGVDLLLSDPPYGINWNVNYQRFTGGLSESHDYGSPIAHDDEPFDPAPLLAFPKVVLFGANHFAARLPAGSWYVWLKRRENQLGTFLSDCELAWRKGGYGTYAFVYPWHGFDRAGERGKTLHPTQKPVALMEWCIGREKGVNLVGDPFMGVGATLLAAKNLGRKAIGIEVEKRYCEIAAKRLAQEVLPLEL